LHWLNLPRRGIRQRGAGTLVEDRGAPPRGEGRPPAARDRMRGSSPVRMLQKSRVREKNPEKERLVKAKSPGKTKKMVRVSRAGGSSRLAPGRVPGVGGRASPGNPARAGRARPVRKGKTSPKMEKRVRMKPVSAPVRKKKTAKRRIERRVISHGLNRVKVKPPRAREIPPAPAGASSKGSRAGSKRVSRVASSKGSKASSKRPSRAASSKGHRMILTASRVSRKGSPMKLVTSLAA